MTNLNQPLNTAWDEARGRTDDGYRRAHGTSVFVGEIKRFDRLAREAWEAANLAPGATRSIGAGNRAVAEEPEPDRTCFERDVARIRNHSPAFRAMSDKTQVFLDRSQLQRSRLTHTNEVAQLAGSIARTLGLNEALTVAVALGHDCGHGPGGHSAETALSPYIEGGFDHAVWGADVALAPHNLCAETLDGIRNHSWKRPAPRTPEGEVVSWSDRIAYCCHDWDDAVDTRLVTTEQLAPAVLALWGPDTGAHRTNFVRAVIEGTIAKQEVCMAEDVAPLLDAYRANNSERIYHHPEQVARHNVVITFMQRLAERFIEHPVDLAGATGRPEIGAMAPGSAPLRLETVRFLVACTDGQMLRYAAEHGWKSDLLTPSSAQPAQLHHPGQQLTLEYGLLDFNSNQLPAASVNGDAPGAPELHDDDSDDSDDSTHVVPPASRRQKPVAAPEVRVQT